MCGYIHTYTYTFMHVCPDTSMSLYTHTYRLINACACIHTYVCTNIHTYIHTYMADTDRHTCLHAYVHTQTDIHACMSTHYTHACLATHRQTVMNEFR